VFDLLSLAHAVVLRLLRLLIEVSF